jgi:hypothetical protein
LVRRGQDGGDGGLDFSGELKSQSGTRSS